jgi:hypothetical protein
MQSIPISRPRLSGEDLRRWVSDNTELIDDQWLGNERRLRAERDRVQVATVAAAVKKKMKGYELPVTGGAARQVFDAEVDHRSLELDMVSRVTSQKLSARSSNTSTSLVTLDSQDLTKLSARSSSKPDSDSPYQTRLSARSIEENTCKDVKSPSVVSESLSTRCSIHSFKLPESVRSGDPTTPSSLGTPITPMKDLDCQNWAP